MRRKKKRKTEENLEDTSPGKKPRLPGLGFFH
jgi:hypothetical protein